MGESTMSFLRRLETQKSEGNDDYDEENLGTTFVASRGGYASSRDAGVLKEKFKSLIRQLPSRSYLDKLVDIFMRTFNDQYYVIDPDILQSQLERWHALPFKVLSAQGPQALSPEMRAFPAVLFQIIATSLLIVVEGGELAATFEGLKFAASMSFEDLSADYSEAGVGIIALIEKKSLTVTAIQAEFLRASFLKFTADVTESVSSSSPSRILYLSPFERLLVSYVASNRCYHSGMPSLRPSGMLKNWECTEIV